MKTDLVLKQLSDNGFYVHDNFLQGKALLGLQESCAKVLLNAPDSDYKFGKAARIGSLEANRIKNPPIAEAFESKELKEIRVSNFVYNQRLIV